MPFVHFRMIVLILVMGRKYTSHGWTCPTNRRVFTEVGERPILPITTNGLHIGKSTFDINTFQIVYNRSNMFTVNYVNGVILGTPYTRGCSLASSADLANGVLDIELDTIQTNDWGTYRLVHTDNGLTVIQCVTLYLLGQPTTPTIFPSGTLYAGTLLSLTCISISTTQPSNHSLAMSYRWTRDGSKVTADSKFSFDSNLKKTMTISGLSRTDDGNSVMECTATEDGGKSSQVTSYTIIVQYGPESIRFNTFVDSQSYNDGDIFTPVTCLADCQPACDFSWEKNGHTLLSSTAVLDLGLVSSGKHGIYTCSATHTSPGHTVTKILNVSIIYGPSTITLSPSTKSYTKNEGETFAQITCHADCFPVCNIVWRGASGLSTVVSENGTLSLVELHRTDSGTYKCEATNPYTLKLTTSQEVSVNVRYGPDEVVLSVPSVKIVSEKDSIRSIDCSADCWPGCDFTWTKLTDNKQINSSNILTFGMVDRFDSGDYKCLARNSALQYSREAEAHFSLRVHYAPDVIISKSNTLWTENTPLHLTCKASGVPAVYNYTGFVQRVGDVVVPNSHAESPGVRDSISVNIPSLQLQDTGIYTCYVHNGIYGVNKQLIQTASQRIDVQAPPIVFAAESNFAGETSGTVNITIPFVSIPEYSTYSVLRHDGQPVLTNGKYTLQMKNNFVNAVFYGKEVTLTGNVLKMTITDLSEEEFGLYTIQITNEINTANFSIHVMGTRKPSPPTELKLISFNDVITFEWKKGFNGGHEQTFVLQTLLYPDGSWINRTDIRESDSTFIKHTDRFEVNLTNQIPGIYYARLLAFNRIGAADPATFEETFKVIEISTASPQISVGPVIGGTVAGIVAALVVVIFLIFVIRRKYACVCLCKLAKREDVYHDNNTDNIIDKHGAANTGLTTAQTYEAVSMTMDTVVYDELKNGSNGANQSDVLNASDVKPLPYYGNVQTGDTTVYSNIIPNTQVQTVL